MHIINAVLGTAVALEFFFIFYLETIATTSQRTAKVFNMSVEELKRPSVTTLFKNQGVYNGLLGILLLLAIFVFHSQAAVLLLLGYIVLVAAYGAITSNPSILLKQGGLAIVTFILVAIFGI
ncbi:DUF1304 domain-containing protein [Bifidobacterium tsurumiense]|uniref:Integral membrane protein n=1 Tax=Bifidobacterium tsurumiense TaxID=356829 RepID=A0A087EKF4_9BIFI|nr:DUF1304 family protein [Bifidobacterium tsurumiense]KFJ08255.1 integral membrane protein [Bifidobacterium tsurumiense]MDY4677327.1 DUF1304 family protein [Bifidobacterium tsurumiense]MSS13209.1 DUF1304 domain-containing protein [Bifidobacterium tsurumiense]